MANMCLLIAEEAPGCSGFGAEPKMTPIAFCEEKSCEYYVAELKNRRDPRLLMKTRVRVVPVPASGIQDLDVVNSGYYIMLR